MKRLGEEYEEKIQCKMLYKICKLFYRNMLESKSDAQNHSISLKESDFSWLQEEYKKQKKESRNF